MAGYFNGNVQIINGTLSAPAKNFKIDHPLDPANKYLVHSCIESSERVNLYRGNAILDSDGSANVDMPEWFEAENRDCSYQLTAIGDAAPNLHVAQKIAANRFVIAGGKPGMEVSWQVTGVRQDAYAKSHPLQVEETKSDKDRGKYLDPTDYGKPATEGIGVLAVTPTGIKPPRMMSPLTKQPVLLKVRARANKPTTLRPQHKAKPATPSTRTP